MTTAPAMSVDWIRLTIGGDEITLAPSRETVLHLSFRLVEYDGYLDSLTAGPPSELHVSVGLVPLVAEAIPRCEMQAREVGMHLGAGRSALEPLSMFSLEAALSGEGLPYNRVAAPRLLLVPGPSSLLDEDLPLPSVQAFTAKVPGGGEYAYMMRQI